MFGCLHVGEAVVEETARPDTQLCFGFFSQDSLLQMESTRFVAELKTPSRTGRVQMMLWQRSPTLQMEPGSAWLHLAQSSGGSGTLSGICDCGCVRYDPDCAGASGNPQAS